MTIFEDIFHIFVPVKPDPPPEPPPKTDPPKNDDDDNGDGDDDSGYSLISEIAIYGGIVLCMGLVAYIVIKK